MSIKRRTIRRYAHEIYPHPSEYEVRNLATDVPYLYAIALGDETWGTNWGDASPEEQRARIVRLTAARQLAYLADALHQGLSGEEAWKWAMKRGWNYEGDVAYERAEHYGVDPTRIKPYPCGPVMDSHDHMASTGNAMGHGIVTRVSGPESECEACTEVDQ